MFYFFAVKITKTAQKGHPRENGHKNEGRRDTVPRFYRLILKYCLLADRRLKGLYRLFEYRAPYLFFFIRRLGRVSQRIGNGDRGYYAVGANRL